MSKQISSLLDILTSRQVSDLIDENYLRQGGYQLYYSIDNHDVIMYCFPGGLYGGNFELDAKGQPNYSLETDYITAYDFFFNNISAKNPIFFLDEYLHELSELRNEIIEAIGKKNLFNYADTFKRYYDNLEDINRMKKDFTLFISLISGTLQNGAMKYNSLVKNPFFLRSEYERSGLENEDYLWDVFLESYVDSYDLSNEIYKQFPGDKKSKKTDSQAIARLITVNKKLLSKDDNKILFLFLSTAFQTRTIFQNEKLQQFLPEIAIGSKQKAFNFNRTAAQVFMMRLIKDLDTEEQLKRLENAKKFIEYRETYQKEIEEYEKGPGINFEYHTEAEKEKLLQLNQIYREYEHLRQTEINSFEALVDDYVNLNFAREAQFRELEKYFEQLSKATVNNNMSSLNRLYRNLKDEYKDVSKQQENIENIENVENAFNIQYVFSAIFKKAMSMIYNGHKLSISRGEDPISGTGQHLPIVFTGQTSQIELLDSLAAFYLSKFAFIDTSNSDSYYLIEQRLKSIAEMAYKGGSKDYDEKLVFYLYLLILPESNVFPGVSNNQHVVDFLRNIFANGELHASNPLYADYLYLLVWVLRRNRDYENAMEFTEKAISQFPKDGRFIHSRFLIRVCIDVESDKKYETERLHKYIEDIELALQLYDPVIKEKSSEIANNIKGTLINSRLFTELLLLKQNCGAEAQKLAMLRENYLKPLKNMFAQTYQLYPEFLQTEAFLESFEFDTIEDRLTKSVKITNAMNSLKRAKEQASNLPGFKIEEMMELEEELHRKKEILFKM